MKTSRAAALVAVAEQASRAYSDVDNLFVSHVPSGKAEELMILTRRNMKFFYDSSNLKEWVWDDGKKKSEFMDPRSHFIIAPDGFLCYRFLVDSGRPVMYVWELHASVPGQGVGSLLLQASAEFCKMHTAIGVQILTCFKTNVGAVKFYKKRGFTVDPSSPQNMPYVILSRKIR